MQFYWQKAKFWWLGFFLFQSLKDINILKPALELTVYKYGVMMGNLSRSPYLIEQF